jgi:hypothetical protein
MMPQPGSPPPEAASNLAVCAQPAERVFGLRSSGFARSSDLGFHFQGWRSNARVLRGGSWNNNARNARAANRNRNHPDNRNHNRGVRVVLGVGASTPRGPGIGLGPAQGLWPELHAPRPVQARRCASPDRHPVSARAVSPVPKAAPKWAAEGKRGRPAKPQTVPWGLVEVTLERPHGTPAWIFTGQVGAPTCCRLLAVGRTKPTAGRRSSLCAIRVRHEISRLVAPRARQ